MRTSKIVSCGLVVILAVYATIFIHAFNAFSNRALDRTTAWSAMTAEP